MAGQHRQLLGHWIARAELLRQVAAAAQQPLHARVDLLQNRTDLLVGGRVDEGGETLPPVLSSLAVESTPGTRDIGDIRPMCSPDEGRRSPSTDRMALDALRWRRDSP